MELPKITVLITTYNRIDLLNQTIDALVSNLNYSGEITYVIANDGEEPLSEFTLRVGTRDSQGQYVNATEVRTNSPRSGLGTNTNVGLRECFAQSEIVLQTQDDYLLIQQLDLDEHVQKLVEDTSAGWIRLRLTQGQNFTGTVVHRYWHLNWHSEGWYIASDQPHLKHKRFHDFHGFYAEGLKVGDTENEWVGRTKQQGKDRGGPSVLIPVDWPCDSSWIHTGDGGLSWKGKGL